jgi:tRNA pseudouridine38-40 synthase
MRIALGIEYDGTNYFGWQKQKNLQTIQEKVEKAVSKIANQKIEIVCAGRTDAGVHALGQVIHFDTDAVRSDEAWIAGTNTYLPTDINILWVKHVSDEFHARYSAISRKYRYIIYNNKIRSAILQNRVMLVTHVLDEKAMHKAGQYLLGTHDFSSFRGSFCQAKTAIRTIEFINISRSGVTIYIDIKANAFLLHMARNIVGMLIMVGKGAKPFEWAKEVLDAKKRTVSAPTAPACGLYLVNVEYKKN